MKKILSFLFLLTLLTTACAAPATTPAVPAAIIENTALPPAQPVQFTPVPTFTAEVQSTIQPTIQPTEGFPTFAPPTELPSGKPNEIRFATNGTYADVTDFIPTGASKTYSVNAMKGQVMSVSTLPQIPNGEWGYIPMQIKGADGNVLCPQVDNPQCMFWRGTLPASQDYFVTLMPNGDVPQFVMRVAINPPGRDVQYFQYSNPAMGLSVTYPDTFSPALPVLGNYKLPPDLTLHFIDSKTYNNTNLSEVYLFGSFTSAPQAVATCTQSNPNGGPEQVIGNKVINGLTFVHSTSEGVGAGNIYQQEIYRAVDGNVCYEVIFYLHSSNIGNYPPDTKVTEFDRDAIIRQLYGIFSNFTFFPH